jgi:hypothetical protein
MFFEINEIGPAGWPGLLFYLYFYCSGLGVTNRSIIFRFYIMWNEMVGGFGGGLGA